MAAPDRVERIVREALDRSVRSSSRATAGRVGETHLLELGGEPARAVCKIGGPSARTGEVIEPLVTRLVTATTGLPCPSVLASGVFRDDGAAESRWALYEFRAGTPPTPFRTLDPSARAGIVREVGAMLGELHATHQFEHTGGLGRQGDELVFRSQTGLNLPERGRGLARRYPGCDPREWQPVLTHGDLFPGNLLVDGDGEVTALVDWGDAHVTTAGYALARAELRFVDWFRFGAPERDRLRRALRRGYRQYRPLPRDYSTVAGFYKLLWLGESLDRHVRKAMSSRGRRQLRQHARSLLG